MAKVKKQGVILKHEIEALAAVLYPTLKEFYESPEGQAQFEVWRAAKAKRGQDGKHNRIASEGQP